MHTFRLKMREECLLVCFYVSFHTIAGTFPPFLKKITEKVDEDKCEEILVKDVINSIEKSSNIVLISKSKMQNPPTDNALTLLNYDQIDNTTIDDLKIEEMTNNLSPFYIVTADDHNGVLHFLKKMKNRNYVVSLVRLFYYFI